MTRQAQQAQPKARAPRGLRVVPAGRQVRGRLYVTTPDGRGVAWYDRETHRVSLLAADRQDDVLAALRPFLNGAYTVGPPPVPSRADLARLTLHPDDDLAPNRPGEALLGELAHGTAGTGGRTRHRLRQDLQAQQRMGAEFDALEDAGWRILHAVPLSGAGVLDHLLIGPAGVLCVVTVPGRRQRVHVGDLLVTVGRAEPRPDPRRARGAAERAARALGVPVVPAVAVVDGARVDVAPTLRDVRVLRDGSSPASLTAAAPVPLTPSDVEALHTRARNRHTWTRP
ncbi:NERD domain-containing protein [Streptomyces sp. NPDC012888]|uniref:NERD domain-containing protein n=1 Tax=Streptomyces sp. NPDC012888 TaxID=3364855 RepID=UPI0036746F3B